MAKQDDTPSAPTGPTIVRDPRIAEQRARSAKLLEQSNSGFRAVPRTPLVTAPSAAAAGSDAPSDDGIATNAVTAEPAAARGEKATTAPATRTTSSTATKSGRRR